ncbi:MAG: nitroreductase family protein [Rikenellaceae bacterium]|nr:nitroreductase family protein [Rikenellaceae bacterium]
MVNIHAQNRDYLFMIEHAVKAPSGHNTQPWLFIVNEDYIQILPDYDKSLPIVDPNNRELFISLGCAAENLCIAASQRGYHTDLSISEEGIITIHLNKDENVQPDTLFDQITIRQTNRSIYNERVISTDLIGLLKSVFKTSSVNAYFYKNGTTEFNSITDYVLAGNETQMLNKEFTDELKSWIRYNKKHRDKTNDGLSYAVFGAPNLPRFIIAPIISSHLKYKKQNKVDRKKIASSSHFILLTTPDSTPCEWIKLGIVLERCLLKATESGIAHAYMNQPIEVEELSEGITQTLNIPNEFPAILLRIGYGEIRPYSKRKDIHEVILSE